MVFAGIDVSKAHLDLALLGPELNRTLRFPNTEEGRKSLLAALLQQRPAWIALEPSSAYPLPLVTLLAQKGFRVALVNPYQVASFRRAAGERNKSDKKDALLLARYAQVYRDHLKPYTLPEKTLRELKELVGYREDLAKRAQAIRNQLEAAAWAGSGRVIPFLQRELAHVQALVEEVEAQIQALLGQIPEAGVLQELAGVGPQVAAAVLAFLPRAVWGRAKAAFLKGRSRGRRWSGRGFPGRGRPSSGGSCTWRPWWRCGVIRSCGPSIIGSFPGASERSKPSWP